MDCYVCGEATNFPVSEGDAEDEGMGKAFRGCDLDCLVFNGVFLIS